MNWWHWPGNPAPARKIKRFGAIAAPALLAAVFWGGVPAALAQQEAKSGRDYRLIGPLPTASGGQIEVIEFFFYACPYCNELQPLLEQWLKNKPADVAFRHLPVVRHESWVPLAKTFFVLEALGELERLHQQVYRSYHQEEMAMSNPEVMADWAQRQGIDRRKFVELYDSEPIRAKLAQAKEYTHTYDIHATPSLVVDGKYLTSSGLTGGVPEVIPVLDHLVRLARRNRAR